MLKDKYKDHFETLRRVYDQALNHHDFDKLIVYSGDILLRHQDDLPYPYITDIQFKALVPLLNAPGSWIIWRLNEKPILLFLQPDDFWHIVPEIPDSFWTPFFEIVAIVDGEKAKKYFGDTSRAVFLGETNVMTRDWNLGQHNPDLFLAELNWSRSYKTEYEQACILEANTISIKGHRAARDAFFSGASELEISLAFQSACTLPEESLAYPSVVGINEHAAILHYLGRSARRPVESHSLLIDAGASFNGYAADITRTYARAGGLFADMVIAFDEMQQLLVSEHIVGRRYFDLSLLTLERVARLLKDFDLVTLEPASCVETGVVNHFVPHGLGHFLGLQVHDVGSRQADSSGALLDIDPKYPKFNMMRTIEPNQVVTVEPGVYFINQLLKPLYEGPYKNAVNWSAIERLKLFGGMRIEDNVLLHENGPINFTREAFAESQCRQ